MEETAWELVRANDYEALHYTVGMSGSVGRLLEKWSEDDALCDRYPGIFRVRGIVFGNEMKDRFDVHN